MGLGVWHDHPPPEKARLQRKTVSVMRKRREWRRRAVATSLEFATWPPGRPGREKCENEVHKSINKVRQWFRDPRARLVVSAVQRRAIAAFRNQFSETT